METSDWGPSQCKIRTSRANYLKHCSDAPGEHDDRTNCQAPVRFLHLSEACSCQPFIGSFKSSTPRVLSPHNRIIVLQLHTFNFSNDALGGYWHNNPHNLQQLTYVGTRNYNLREAAFQPQWGAGCGPPDTGKWNLKNKSSSHAVMSYPDEINSSVAITRHSIINKLQLYEW